MVQELVKKHGGFSHWARVLGVTPQAVYQWKGKIPIRHVLKIEEHFGIPRQQLRPDVYPPQ